MGNCKPVKGSRAYLEIQPDGSHVIIHDYSGTAWGKAQNEISNNSKGSLQSSR